MVLPAARITSDAGTQGSGFVLAKTENATYVLTCHHVIKDSIKQSDRWDPVDKSSKKVERLQPVQVELFRYDERGRHLQTIATSADIAAYQQYGDKWDFEGDLALLKLRAPVEVPAARVINEEDYSKEVRMLDDVVMIGCPERATVPLPTKGHIASLTEERGDVGLLMSHVFGNPGSSGSAVYRFSEERRAYEVVAVHSMAEKAAGSLTNSGTGSYLRLAVPIPVLYEFLRSNGLADLLAPPPVAGNEQLEERAGDEGDAEKPDVPGDNDTSTKGTDATPGNEEPVAEPRDDGDGDGDGNGSGAGGGSDVAGPPAAPANSGDGAADGAVTPSGT